MAFLDKGTLWGIKKEATYAAATTITYPTDVVELIDPSLEGSVAEIERAITKNSLVKAQSLPGKETSSGTLAVEVTSTVTNVLNGDVLYESAMGVRIPAVTMVAPTAGPVGTTLTFASTAAYQIGQGLKCKIGAGVYQYVNIVGMSSTILTVAPALTATCTEVTGLLSYRIAVPSTPVTSFTVEEYLTGDASSVKYKYAGVVAKALSISFPVADIIKATFSVEGAGFTASTSVASTKVCMDLKPHIAKNIQFLYSGTTYDINELTVNVESDIYDSETLTSSGISKKLVTGKSSVGGSFIVDYDGLDLFTKYKASTTGALVFSTSTSEGKKFGGYAPKVALKNVQKTKDGGIYKHNADLQMLSSDNCINNVEDALSIWFE